MPYRRIKESSRRGNYIETLIYADDIISKGDESEIQALIEAKKQVANCRDAINKAINDNYNGRSLPGGFIDGVVRKYGGDLVEFVLATYAKERSGDARISRKNQGWAQKTETSTNKDIVRICASIPNNPGLINLCIDEINEDYSESYRRSIGEAYRAGDEYRCSVYMDVRRIITRAGLANKCELTPYYLDGKYIVEVYSEERNSAAVLASVKNIMTRNDYNCEYGDDDNLFIYGKLQLSQTYGTRESYVGEKVEKKANGKWINRGKDGTHGEFKTKKAAQAQTRAMYANGYKGESLKKSGLLGGLKESYREPGRKITKAEADKLVDFCRNHEEEYSIYSVSRDYNGVNIIFWEAKQYAAEDDLKNFIQKVVDEKFKGAGYIVGAEFENGSFDSDGRPRPLLYGASLYFVIDQGVSESYNDREFPFTPAELYRKSGRDITYDEATFLRSYCIRYADRFSIQGVDLDATSLDINFYGRDDPARNTPLDSAEAFIKVILARNYPDVCYSVEYDKGETSARVSMGLEDTDIFIEPKEGLDEEYREGKYITSKEARDIKNMCRGLERVYGIASTDMDYNRLNITFKNPVQGVARSTAQSFIDNILERYYPGVYYEIDGGRDGSAYLSLFTKLDNFGTSSTKPAHIAPSKFFSRL